VKAELLRQIRETYLFNIDITDLELLSVPEIVARLDPDTHFGEMRRRMSLDFMRGSSLKGSVRGSAGVGSRRGYHSAGFFGRRTLEDVRKALLSFSLPLWPAP